MTKLTSVRVTRRYSGDPELNDVAEVINALVYVVATALLLAAFSFELNRDHPTLVPWLAIIGFLLIAAVNLHDLVAQLNGFDYRLPLLTSDYQLGLVDVAAPFLLFLGSMLYAAGVLTISIARRGFEEETEAESSGRSLLLAGPIFLLLGSISNSFQVYERLHGLLQALQHAVGIPMLLGSALFVISGAARLVSWPKSALGKAKDFGIWLDMIAAILWLIAALVNVYRVLASQDLDRTGWSASEPLRGGAEEQLLAAREQHTGTMETPRMEEGQGPRGRGRVESEEDPGSYKEAVERGL